MAYMTVATILLPTLKKKTIYFLLFKQFSMTKVRHDNFGKFQLTKKLQVRK